MGVSPTIAFRAGCADLIDPVLQALEGGSLGAYKSIISSSIRSGARSEGRMVNPVKWMRIYQITVIAFVAAGALAGAVSGYHVSQWTWGGIGSWVIRRTDDAVGWATLGAIVAGVIVYGGLSVSWPGRSRGVAGAAPGRPRNRTQTPRAENTSPSSRRKRERSGRVSLQQALQSTGSTAWRA
jgi:hypothetical protein